jgi:hypothetical protein
MAALNITRPTATTHDDLWEIIQEQQALLARYHSVTQATRFRAAGQAIELPKFARFDPALSDRHDRLLSLIENADAGMAPQLPAPDCGVDFLGMPAVCA